MNEHKIYSPSYTIGEQAELPSTEEPSCIRCGLNYNRQIIPQIINDNRTCYPKTQNCFYCKKEFETLDQFFCSDKCKINDLAEYKQNE